MDIDLFVNRLEKCILKIEKDKGKGKGEGIEMVGEREREREKKEGDGLGMVKRKEKERGKGKGKKRGVFKGKESKKKEVPWDHLLVGVSFGMLLGAMLTKMFVRTEKE